MISAVSPVDLSPKLEALIVPSKFYGIAAAGRPTIFISAEDGEIGRILEENACGFTVAPGDGEALMESILVLAGNRDICDALGASARVAFEVTGKRRRLWQSGKRCFEMRD
jgi:colanic acid biosynthesis glycosyl transferase WcaI